MRDFINQFGKENLTIIAIVILIILIALVLIVLLEKRKINKNSEKEKVSSEGINEALKTPEKHLNYKPLEALRSLERMEDTLKYRTGKVPFPDDEKITYQKPEPHREYNYENKEVNNEIDKHDVVYKQNTVTPEQAKEKLEEVTKKLVEEQEPDHTVFEEEQEEKSIISYEELKAAITLEELYKKEGTNIKSVERKTVPSINSGSGVISPIYGRRDMNKVKSNNSKYQEIANENSEDFLEKLKDFRNKLD